MPDLDSYRWRRYVRDLRKRFVYVQSRTGISVVINGESVDKGDPLEAVADSPHPPLTRETEDAILGLEYTPREGLNIYSNRLYVTTKREYGVGRVVVLKGNLTLNFARNDIQSGCDRWQRIDNALEQARDDLYADVSDDRLTAESREVMIEAMASNGDDTWDEQWADRKLYQLATESRISLRKVKLEKANATHSLISVHPRQKSRTKTRSVTHRRLSPLPAVRSRISSIESTTSLVWTSWYASCVVSIDF